MRLNLKIYFLPGIFLLLAGVLAFPFSPTLLAQSLSAIPVATLAPSVCCVARSSLYTIPNHGGE